jgi:CheY-like chemotaxis protein
MTIDTSSLRIAFVECPRTKMYSDFLARRGYGVLKLPAPDASVYVICQDHVADPGIQAAVAGFAGPKLVLGADPPAAWSNARRLGVPLLPLDLEQHIQGLFAAAKSTQQSYSILVVEDDVTVATTVQRVFEQSGFAVRLVHGFAELAPALQHRPDFIVMDLNLPGLSGEKLGEIIRMKKIPTAIFSGEPMARLEEAQHRIGAVAAFPKEAPINAVADWIRSYLEGRRS